MMQQTVAAESKQEKLCYCKGDHVMRFIYGSPGQFRKPLATPMATIHSRPNRRAYC